MGFRVNMLYHTIRFLKRTTIRMILLLTKVSVRNLASTQPQISALHMAKITEYSDGPYAFKKWKYPPADLGYPSSQRLDGDSGTTANNKIVFIRNDQGADKQLEHFVPNLASGLTLNGLGRINRSIEAFGYCILGAQANTRSSIIGSIGTARNTQTDFLVLFEDAIRTLTVSNGPAKYQEAIEKTKVRLNFAIARASCYCHHK